MFTKTSTMAGIAALKAHLVKTSYNERLSQKNEREGDLPHMSLPRCKHKDSD